MASPALTDREPAEAVILSGSRRGEFILLDEQGRDITREVEILLDQMVETAQSITERPIMTDDAPTRSRFNDELLHDLERQLEQVRADLRNVQERLTRLEVSREADRAHQRAEFAEFKAQAELALLRQLPPAADEN